jgi:hypothetical protein
VAQMGDKVWSRPTNGGQESLPPRKTGDTGVAVPAENHYVARSLKIALVTAVAALALASQAQASGGNYVFAGGNAKQHTQVRSALDASSFNWSLVPAQIKIHIAPVGQSYAIRGEIWLDARLLNAGRFSWGVVQDEYSHQVDFYLFDAATRTNLNALLGGKDWCYGVSGLLHSEYGCERFASTLVWSYWPSRSNAYKPDSKSSESAALAPARFRAIMKQIVGA